MRLKLTEEARGEISSCAARTIWVSVGKGKRRRSRSELFRNTTACAPKPIDLSRASECDFTGQQAGSRCLFPFPSDFHTVADPSSATGKRVAFKAASMPRNLGGTPIAPGDYDKLDGFSPGSAILLKVPGLDSPAAMQQTGAAPINHIGRYAEPDQPIVVIDATTGQRHPIWSEVDAAATSAARHRGPYPPGDQLRLGPPLHRRDAEPEDGVRRHHPRTRGVPLLPRPAPRRVTRDQRAPPHFEALFKTLRYAGIRRSDLYLAWDFTVGTDERIARQMLHMRDDAFAELGDTDLDNGTLEGGSPAFSVTTVDEFTPAEDAEVARRIRGTFTVPCYLAPDCAPGGAFAPDGAGLPTRNGDWTANFDCIVPRVAVDGPTPVPGRASTYGHGLFGSASEVFNSDIQQELANTHGFTFCATDEIGMSGADVSNTATTILPDLSKFRCWRTASIRGC